MTGNDLLLICTIIGAVLAVATFVQTVRKQAKDSAQAEQAERANLSAQGYKQGRDSRDDEVRQITAQLADAVRDRDRAQVRADEYEARYLNQLGRPGGSP